MSKIHQRLANSNALREFRPETNCHHWSLRDHQMQRQRALLGDASIPWRRGPALLADQAPVQLFSNTVFKLMFKQVERPRGRT